MTELSKNVVPVTQADRDAAASCVISRSVEHSIRNGLADSQPMVQIFARYRLAHTAALQSQCDRYRVALLDFVQGADDGYISVEVDRAARTALSDNTTSEALS